MHPSTAKGTMADVKKSILIIDDDPDMCTLLGNFLKRKGYATDSAQNGAKGLAKFSEGEYDVVLCDFRLGDKDGKDVLMKIKETKPATIVIIITGYSDIKTAVDVIKHGAYDYITKPLIPDEVIHVIENALSSARKPSSKKTVATKPSDPEEKPVTIDMSDDFMMGNSQVIQNLYHQVAIVAPTNYSVILYGESGTGKEVIAKTIHRNSLRKNGPFVALDCGTLSRELAGSELFGHVKGAFTGAVTDKTGSFELADGGTLFLDEVANLGPDVQASLLRVIQERKFKRIGGTKETKVDVRIIVASNENLQKAYQKGKFREDLYHRFNEFSINLPPLRERGDDVLEFAQFFLEKSKSELKREIEGFDNELLEIFQAYPWPGNLRELRNVVRRSALLTPVGKIRADVLPWEITQSPSYDTIVRAKQAEDPVTEKEKEVVAKESSKDNTHLKDAVARTEYETIMNVLKEVNFNKTRAAEILKIDRKTLYNKIKAFETL